MADGDFDFVSEIPTEQLQTESTDAKFKRVVCRFWLNGECIHDTKCKFLHVYDLAKMPECRWGSKCQKKGCVFKHLTDAEKDECANFRLGFCSFGPVCKYRHDVKKPTELPAISEAWTHEYIADKRSKRKAVEEPEKWRVGMCPVLEKLGWCSFFDNCAFAHNPEQLRGHSTGGGKRQRDKEMEDYRRAGFADGASKARRMDEGPSSSSSSFGGGAGGGGGQNSEAAFRPTKAVPNAITRKLLDEHSKDAISLDLPDKDGALAAAAATAGASSNPHEAVPSTGPASTAYFVVRTLSPENLALSLKRGDWIVSQDQGKRILEAMMGADGSGANGVGQVLLIFSILGSQYYQGIARVRAPPEPLPSTTAITDSMASEGSTAPITHDQCVSIPVEWLRTCTLSFAETAGVLNTAGLPLQAGYAAYATAPQVCRSKDLQQLSTSAGRCLTLLLYRAADVSVNLSGISTAAPFDVFTGDATAKGREVQTNDPVPAEVQTAEANQQRDAARWMPQQQQHRGGAGGPMAGAGAGMMMMGGGGPHFNPLMMQQQQQAMMLQQQQQMLAAAAANAAAVAAAAAAGAGAPGPAAGPGGANYGLNGPGTSTGLAAKKGLPPILFLPAIPPGQPANPIVAALLDGRPHPSAPAAPAPQVAADALMAGARGGPGYVFAINSISDHLALESGVFAAPEDEEHASTIKTIAPGTPIVLLHIHRRELFGLFMARTAGQRDLVSPDIFPKMKPKGTQLPPPGSTGDSYEGVKTITFPYQCQAMCVAPAPPMPNPVFAPIIGQRPDTGPISPPQMHALAVQMFSTLPPPMVFRIAGLLMQMQAIGMPPMGLIQPQSQQH